MCDARSFDQDQDSQIADAVYPDWTYENVLVHFQPGQKWYYFSKMDESETMLFKCADSDDTACGRGYELHFGLPISPWHNDNFNSACPHGAFDNPLATDSSALRESIESRVFLLWTPIQELPPEVGTIYGKRY